MKVIFNYATRQFESMEPTMRDRFQLGGRVNFDKGGIAQVVEYINSLPDGTEVSTKDIRDFIEKNNINASPTSIRNIIAGSAPGKERFKDTIKFVDQKGVIKFNEDTFKQIDELLENPKITSFRELGEALGYKTPKPSGKRGVTVGGGTPLSRNSAIIKAYVKSRGGDPFEVFKVGAYKRGQPLVEKVLELQAKGESTNTIAQKLFKGNRTNVRRIFRLFRPEAIKDPVPKSNIPGTTTKTRASALRDKREAQAFKAVGKKTAEQTKTVINTIKNKNADILKMSDAQILNDPKIRYSMSIDATGLKLGEPIKFDKYADLSDKEFVKMVKQKAKNKLFYTPEHISEVAKGKLNTAFPNNIVNAPGRMTSQIGLIKTYLRNNPTGEFAKQADEVLLKTGMQFKTGGETFGVKENIEFNSKTNKSNIVENYFKDTKPIRAKTIAKKGAKTIAKQIPLLGTLIGAADAAEAFSQGVRNPLDLYTAFEVSPEVALQQKEIREDPTGKLLQEEIANLPDITQDYQMSAAQGGRVGFADGTPDPFVDQALAALESPNVAEQFIKQNSPSVGEMVFGKEGDRTLMQSFNTQFLDPRAFPYYGAKTLEGVTRIPEYMIRTVPALGDAVAGAIQGRPQVLQDLIKNLSPEFTDKLQKDFGLKKLIQDLEKDRTSPQKITGGLLEFAGEIPGPVTPFILFKQFPKLKKQLEDLVGTGKAMEQVNREIEKKGAVDQTRRDIVLSIGAGGAVGLLKYLGLDNLFKVAPKVVEKAAPEIITKGGTPKYFFDFVNLIKSKGDDISEKAATIERQKVYDYNGYTLTEQLDTGKINIRKETEGGGSYSIGDGEYETIDGVLKVEEINYNPPETIINDKGKSVRVPDDYSEDIAVPDLDGGLGDVQPGLDSIDEVLELLAKDGKKYSLDELIEMGVSPDLIGDDFLLRILKDPSELKITKIRSKFDKKLDAIKKERSNKAGGGIMKMAGDDSGPPPKSGPTPHGLPYVAKNVKPIKERK